MGFEIHTAAGINIGDNSDIKLLKSQKNFVLDFDKSKKYYRNIKTVLALAKIIRREKYDIVSTHSTLAGLIGRLAVMLARNQKIIVIHTSHGYLFNDDKNVKSSLMIFIEKFLSLRTDALFVMNGEDRQIAEKYKLCRKTENIRHINGMGINAEKLKSDKSNCAELKKYKIPENKKHFLCVGEFSKRKNQKNIIYAFSRFIHGLPDNLYNTYHLVFIGDGKLFDECGKLCKTLGITGHVTFCGYVGETSAFYQFLAYCVVSASEFEGLPFNIMESLYYGKPVIASNVKGHKDLISDGVNGYLYKYNNPVQLSELFGKITDADIYADLRENARLDEKYYFDNVKKYILNCYGNIHS